MQFPSFHVLGNLFFIFSSMSPAFRPSPTVSSLPDWDSSLTWILPPVTLYYSGVVGWRKSGPPRFRLVNWDDVACGPPRRKRNASRGHRVAANWGRWGRTTLGWPQLQCTGFCNPLRNLYPRNGTPRLTHAVA